MLIFLKERFLICVEYIYFKFKESFIIKILVELYYYLLYLGESNITGFFES